MPSPPSPSYDRRLVGILLSELEVRGSPRYPQSDWFSALWKADYRFRYLGPLKPLPDGPGTGNRAHPEMAGVAEARSRKQLYAHNYGDRSEELLKSVNGACTRWLYSH